MTVINGTGHQQADNSPHPDGASSVTPMTDAFLAFHRRNPKVYCVLRDLAREWHAQGKNKCGIDLLYNVARWRMSLDIEGDEIYQLNDHFRAFYARALMHFEPDLAGMFDLRRAPEADAWIASLRQAEQERAVA